MDFKKLLNKLHSIDPTNVRDPQGVQASAIAANKPAATVKLDEAAQLRVLSGRSTMLAESAIMEKKLTTAEKGKKEEVVKSMKKSKGDFVKRYGKKGDEVMHATATKVAKKAAESIEVLDTDEDLAEVFDADAKVGDKTKTAKGGTVTKTKTGITHKAGPGSYGGSDDKDTDPDADDTASKKSKKIKEEMKVGDKKQSSTGGTIEKTKTGVKHTSGKNYGGEAAEKEEKKKVKEGAKPDFLDMDKDGDKKEPMKKAVADKKAGPKKGVNPFAKKTVKESVEPTLTFIKCLQAVKESNGSLQIDPTDKALWNWAQRVAATKAGSGIKADAYAAKVYENVGGAWSLHNTLTENQ
jgi:hypothetical protein